MAIRPDACGRDPAAVLCMLWLNELTQAYQCRCGPPADAAFVGDTLRRIARRKLGLQASPDSSAPPEPPLVFADFVRVGVPRHERAVEMVTGTHSCCWSLHAACCCVLLHVAEVEASVLKQRGSVAVWLVDTLVPRELRCSG